MMIGATVRGGHVVADPEDQGQHDRHARESFTSNVSDRASSVVPESLHPLVPALPALKRLGTES